METDAEVDADAEAETRTGAEAGAGAEGRASRLDPPPLATGRFRTGNGPFSVGLAPKLAIGMAMVVCVMVG